MESVKQKGKCLSHKKNDNMWGAMRSQLYI